MPTTNTVATRLRIGLIGGVSGALLTTMALVAAAAARPPYALKVQATDKLESAKVFEAYVLEQARGSTSLAGSKLNVRILSTTTAHNKSGKKQSTKSWLSALKNDDLVTVTGGYRKSDNTFEASKVVNRSR